jgi:hypothetical protein
MKAKELKEINDALNTADGVADKTSFSRSILMFYWLARAAVFALCAIADAINGHD